MLFSTFHVIHFADYSLYQVSYLFSSTHDGALSLPFFLFLSVGYAYFDVFNQNARPQTLSLLSPPLDKSEDNAPVCLSFWYAYFGASDTTRLKVVRESYDRSAAEEDDRFGGAIVVRTRDTTRAKGGRGGS